MRQVIRRVVDRKGRVSLREVPTPHVGDNQVLVSVRFSLISSGTELLSVSKSPVELARQTLKDSWMRAAVKNLLLSYGIRQTIDVIRNELFLWRTIGYSGAGVVIAKGRNVDHVRVGDRVAYAGQGHAEQVAASSNHVVAVPDGVELRHAAFATVGAIALQGVRRAECAIGEWAVVYGLGLVGQLTAQILRAAGVRVIGVDLSETRLSLASQCGVLDLVNASTSDPVDSVLRITGGKGADCTVICAFSREPVIANNAMKMTRKQGRVVFVGLVKMDLERMPFFLNELDLRFSRAYGPGSYDESYEKGRTDYPYHYVRWTESRNLAEVLRLVGEGVLKLEPLIDDVLPIERVQEAFDRIRTGNMKSVALLLSYPGVGETRTKVELLPRKARRPGDKVRAGVIGVGNFIRNIQLPNLSRLHSFNIRALCSASGLSAAAFSERFGASYVTTDYREVLADPDVDMVIIATRHDMHARIAIEAAKAGKHILLEKPVAMTMADLEAVKAAVTEAGVCFMVGYNRRYSHAAKLAAKYITHRPVMIKYTVNVRNLPADHWTLDPVEGGGRLIGESEHFFDLMNYFADSRPVDVQALSLPLSAESKESMLNFMVQVRYGNGSLGQLTYTNMGGPRLPRERVELFCGDRHVEIIDFKRVLVNGRTVSRKADMGHLAELEAFLELMGGGRLQSCEEAFSASAVVLKASELLRG
jgi:predicted dehydrogenase/threonine dehydrogenase-like Zn-dependent dehydrogenase